MKPKRMEMDRALRLVRDGSRLMVGGFLGGGAPNALAEALLDTGVRDLTIICNDSAFPEIGVGRLIVEKRVSRLIASHIGTNPETQRQMTTGELEVELVPQGTLAERIRAAGAGLGGVMTPTGVGTLVEQGKQKIELGGRVYLIELPLRADVAFVWAHRADETGNLCYIGSTRNMNPLMATAADVVVAEVEQIVAVGALSPEEILVPGVYIDHIVEVRRNG